MAASTIVTIDEDVRQSLVSLAAIPNTDAVETLTGICFEGRVAHALDSYCVGVVELHSGNVVPRRILPAKPLAAALKMAGKEDMVRIVFGARQAVVTVGSPTLPFDDPDADEGLPPVSVDLTYLDPEGWPDLLDTLSRGAYGAAGSCTHHIVSSDRLAKIAKLRGGGEVRLEPPVDGGAWRVSTPFSKRLLGYMKVTRVTEDGEVE